jgi:hypothetical protein
VSFTTRTTHKNHKTRDAWAAKAITKMPAAGAAATLRVRRSRAGQVRRAKKSLWSERPGDPTAAAGAALGLPGEAVYKVADHKHTTKKEGHKYKIMQDLNFGYHILFSPSSLSDQITL